MKDVEELEEEKKTAKANSLQNQCNDKEREILASLSTADPKRISVDEVSSSPGERKNVGPVVPRMAPFQSFLFKSAGLVNSSTSPS